MGKIGILWSDPAHWVIGQNCHLENIGCPACGSIESAYVLDTTPEQTRFHICERCGAFIGPHRWRVVDGSYQEGTGKADAQPEPVPVSTIAGNGDTAGNRPAAGIPLPDPAQQPGRKPAPVQGSLFEA